MQGGRCCASARAALTERSGSSTKGRTPNIRYFVAKLSNVAIYALFERHSHFTALLVLGEHLLGSQHLLLCIL